MERIEYVSRMEDYAAWIQLDMLYIRRWGRTRRWQIIRQCLLIDLILLGLMIWNHTEWTELATFIGILVIIQTPLILRAASIVRRVSAEEARRIFDGGKADGEPRAIWFDGEKVVDEGSYRRLELLWPGIREAAVSTDWLSLNGGAATLYLRRQSVTAGDFDRFVAEAVNTFAAAKRQQEIEPKIIRLDTMIYVDGVPISTGRKAWFGFLWGGAFLFAGGLILAILGIGAMFVMGLLGILEYVDNDKIPEMLAILFLIGTCVSALAGVILGASGVLPGVRRKDQTSKIKE